MPGMRSRLLATSYVMEPRREVLFYDALAIKSTPHIVKNMQSYKDRGGEGNLINRVDARGAINSSFFLPSRRLRDV